MCGSQMLFTMHDLPCRVQRRLGDNGDENAITSLCLSCCPGSLGAEPAWYHNATSPHQVHASARQSCEHLARASAGHPPQCNKQRDGSRHEYNGSFQLRREVKPRINGPPIALTVSCVAFPSLKWPQSVIADAYRSGSTPC